MITLDEAKAFLCVDTDIDDALIRSFISAADEFLVGAVGKACPDEVMHGARANVIRKLLVRDMYDNRQLAASGTEQPRGIVQSMLMQMRVEAMPE